MKSLPVIFCGVFFTIALSWTGLILTSQIQYGSLERAAASPDEPTLYPLQMSGAAIRGKDVYIAQGCLYCHTQQVRPRHQGGDIERGWGQRYTVARDYILQERVLLGTMRTGPDLADIGTRQKSNEWHYQHLFDPQLTSPGSVMPPFRFLFEQVPVMNGGRSDAIKLPDDYAFAPAPGYQWVPKQEARDLVQYLHSLRLNYNSPESRLEE